MMSSIHAADLKARLSQAGELALLDVREHGQYGEGHLFFAASLPYSRFEIGLPSLVPNPAVELVLCDAGDGVAARAAKRAEALGYRRVRVLAGGTPAWQAAGYTLYAGVNVPSKTFGELVEQRRRTPHVTARELHAMLAAGENCVILDGRPFAEFRRMNIPGGICCPNGELALRVGDLVPDPQTKIIVTCAGRTRSIIGAQTLIDFGVANPVYALENGTQGWSLAGLELERHASRCHAASVGGDLDRLATRARGFAAKHGVAFVGADEANAWCGEQARTTYLLDVRTSEEFAFDAVGGFVHAPGGQLVQATDQWVGVRGARLVLVDGEGVRAPVTAAWLRQLGHEAYVLEDGVRAAAKLEWPRPSIPAPAPLPSIAPQELSVALQEGRVCIIDLRPGMSFRHGHIPEARWSIRPRLEAVGCEHGMSIVLVADEPALAALAAVDLAAAGHRDIRVLAGGQDAWRALALPVARSGDDPADADMIDFLFFTSKRHEGSAEAARQYLAWEVGLVDQLDAQERAAFRIAGA
jgi:rhodanese-related sulfurtransferase